MKKKPKIIVITGAESTGKSELTKLLANHYNAPFVPEYAREYVEKLNREYTYKDVENIAKKQVDQLNLQKSFNNEFVFIDTWLVITKVWFDVVFNKCPDWIDEELRSAEIDLFLICDTDLPWVPDSVRENGGEKRNFLQKKYIDTVKAFNFKCKIVSGKNNDRFNNALKYISQLNEM